MQAVLAWSVLQLLPAAFAAVFVVALVFGARFWIIARRKASIKHELDKSLADLNQANAGKSKTLGKC